MEVCRRCLYNSNHPLNITFNHDGVCSGCIVHDEKDVLDWRDREEKLKRIIAEYRCKSGRNYDCIVPVTGARDSYFIVHTVKNVLGLNPLLVTYNKQYNTAVGIRNLANLRIRFNCDIMTLTVSPEIIRKITRATFRRLGSVYWHCHAGGTVFPVQMAVKLKIPLVIWGGHQGLDQVGMFSHVDEVEMTRKYRMEHDLMGYEAEDLVSDFDGLTRDDIKSFIYPESREVEQVGVRGIYLGNYLRWDSKSQHELMIARYGYEGGVQSRTFDSYSDADCWVYSDVHDYMKLIKHGVGKVLDHATRDIRLGHLSRTDGLILARRYTSAKMKNLDLFLNWLGITESAFHFIADQHRNKEVWKRDKNWDWVFEDPLQHATYLSDVTSDESFVESGYQATIEKGCTDRGDKYILVGKGVL